MSEAGFTHTLEWNLIHVLSFLWLHFLFNILSLSKQCFQDSHLSKQCFKDNRISKWYF